MRKELEKKDTEMSQLNEFRTGEIDGLNNKLNTLARECESKDEEIENAYRKLDELCENMDILEKENATLRENLAGEEGT